MFSSSFRTESLRGQRCDEEVYSVINASVESDYPTPEYPTKPRSRHPSKAGETSRPRYDSLESSSDEEAEADQGTVHLCGADIGDLPTEYVVKGLRANEFPVIGTYVDKRILPGFLYRVRKLDNGSSTSYLFKGKALTLLNVGMGYGKRITFDGDRSNYFYSDTNPAGFGFSLVAAEVEDVFTVTKEDSIHQIAEAQLINVAAQRELATEVKGDGSVVKKVAVTFTCMVNYSGNHHGLMPLYSQERIQTTALAYIVKKKGARKAFTTYLKNIELKHHGCVVFKA